MSASAPETPRFRLFDGPSPLAPLPRFSAALGGRAEIWIKREDLLPLAFGGNKLRNLEFLVGAALAEGADTLVTSGRRWSNHCRLTAAAGAKAGLAVEIVVSGPPASKPGPGLRMMAALGAVVHQLPTADRAARDAEIGRVAREIEARGGRPYVIAVGGTGAVGAWGQVLAAMELFDQAHAAGLTVDVIVVPSATGGTQAGLIAGAASRSPATRVAGVVVARPASELRPAIATMVSELMARASSRPGSGHGSWPGTLPGTEPGPIDLDETQLGDGYGRPTQEAADAADLLARTEGILVDPIYTAKALASLVDRVRGGAWDRQRVVFWHAGGLPGIFEPLD
jgi:1-aminocyclopropane-1-carboxylate deaminase/D-cysteine desulfhydrase-like pyridoxal-dependent ACC family enzyme